MVHRLGLRGDAIYWIGDPRPFGTTIAGPDTSCVVDASLAPGGDLFAYVSCTGQTQPAPRVYVVDLSGAVTRVFPGGVRCLWSPDGSRLAIIYGRMNTSASIRPDSVAVWHRSNDKLSAYRQRPLEIGWGPSDTLFLAYLDSVKALSLSRGTVTSVDHLGADVSPDGLYSIQRLPGWTRFHLREERTGFEVSDCVVQEVGDVRSAVLAPPFWVRLPSVEHLVCLSIGESFEGRAGQAGCRTGVVDPRTLDLVQSFPGKAVGPTADGTGVVVLRGDTLAIVDFNPYSRQRDFNPLRRWGAGNRSVKVRVRVTAWGKMSGEEAISTHVYQVREGDWLPDNLEGYSPGACRKFFRVAAVESWDRIRLEFVPGLLWVKEPGGSNIQTGSAIVTHQETEFGTISFDGGQIVRLSILR